MGDTIPAMVTLVLVRLFAVVLLVAANAFFVAAEFALVSLRETRIQQLIAARRIGARIVLKLHQNLDEVLNAVQFGITIASLALGWVGEPLLARMIEPWVMGVPYASLYAHTIALVVAFTFITYLHVILGEVVPKSVALQRAERVALAVAAPMDFFLVLFRPFLYVMNNSSRLVLRMFRMHPVPEGRMHSAEELKMVVTASRNVGFLDPAQEEMIQRALELRNVSVREIMVPRPDVFALPADMTLEEAMRRVVEDQHSRVPVYEPRRGPEHIIGILHAKDLARLMEYRSRAGRLAQDSLRDLRIRQVMRDVLVVPESKPVLDLLTEFKQRRRQLAVVVDEFGSTSGVVSLEDALEQIVGEIEDEFDVEEPAPLAAAGKTLVMEGSANIRDLELQYGLRLPRDEGFETLGGFVLSQLQRIPAGGESFEYQGRRFTVLEMESLRVARVEIEALEPAPSSQTSEHAGS